VTKTSLLAIVFLLPILSCSDAGSVVSINSYETLEVAFPPVPRADPLIAHDNTYPNYAPVGWVVDPADSNKFLLYVNKFQTGDTDADAKLTVYSGARSDPYTLTLVGDAVVKGGGGAWDSRGIYISGNQVVSDNGVIHVLYGARASGTDYYRVGYAYSSDGRTFTKHASNPVLTPPVGYQRNGGGYASGIFFKHGSTFYFWVMADFVANDGHFLTYSTDLVSWTDNGTNMLPKGSAGEFDNVGLESGKATVFPGDGISVLYIGWNGTRWAIGAAHTNDPTVPVTKSVRNPIFLNDAGPWRACPILAQVTPGRWVLYYQQRGTSPVVHWDIYAAEFPVTGGNLQGGLIGWLK